MGDSSVMEDPVRLPTADLVTVDHHSSLLLPLSRRGYGPGLIIVLPEDAPTYTQGGIVCEDGIPPPILKWAEEGFAVVEIRESAFKATAAAQEAFAKAAAALESCKACPDGSGVGLVVYDASLWDKDIKDITFDSRIKAAVIYGNATEKLPTAASIPCLYHLAGKGTIPKSTDDIKMYSYPTAKANFAIPCQADFDSTEESVSHTRNLTFLKKYIRGADFDLEAIWEEHTYFEFADRSAAKTMGTMVQEPYVNHITTMTGGIGRVRLTKFYQNNFIHNNPDDTEMQLVSRTIGIDRVVDEFIFKFTHDREMDWMIPGIPPTGRRVEVPFTAVVCIRGDRLYHEHIAWDQASVLIQLGLMPEYLPFPYPLPDGKSAASGKRFEYRVPAAGIDISTKMLDKNSLPSNSMFEYQLREVDA
ncbi:carboxymethylenebutenolidase [Exophiala viscosa]|uniref:Carboxymethylenebutenolidase n=1 Tax=Exophiala viscosa TaxID=2486360 RepID=A0AAN6I9C8_9EURO|nr:carboxymethylenebutenolidase [Exophiala viscosa]KAI1620880.1 carboxymethylenebutenolidase [Exophiala viscosa]